MFMRKVSFAIIIVMIMSISVMLVGCSAILSGLGGSSGNGTTESKGRPEDDTGSSCLKYALNAEGTGYVLIGLNTSNIPDEIVISPMYNGLPVVEIAPKVFSGKSIAACTMPDTIVRIGAEAFYKCDEMTSIKIPKDCEIIEELAFAYCKINSISWGKNLISIGEKAFKASFNCSSVRLPDGLEKIGKEAFFANNVMFYIPKSVNRIGELAFGVSWLNDTLKPLYCGAGSKGVNWHDTWNKTDRGKERPTFFGMSGLAMEN